MKSVTIIGPQGAGKKTIAGHIIFMLGADLNLIGKLEESSRDRYDQVLPALREMQQSPKFYTPSFMVQLDTAGTEKAQDCTILVVAPHATETWESSVAEEIRNSKAPILCVVTKMDLFDWNQGVFDDTKESVRIALADATHRRVSYVPVSGMSGENILESTSRCTWTSSTLIGAMEEMLKQTM